MPGATADNELNKKDITMVNVLYAVASFTCALVAIILPVRINQKLRCGGKTERAFLYLIRWTAVFCMADGLWGIMASELVMNDTLLFIMSCVFHSSAAVTPAFWLYFVINYLGTKRLVNVYKYITLGIISAELVLIIINIFNKMMFYVAEDGTYSSTPVRKLLFYMQYATYVTIGIVSVVNLLREKAEARKISGFVEHNYMAVLLFVASPILCGVFQMIYPDAPAYSIGYTLGICVIYSFVLTDMLEKQALENAKAEAASQSKTEFLFNMSHDIRTPMNAILGYTNIGLRHCDNTQYARENFEKIRQAGGHLLNLINDILEMSRIEAGKMELIEGPVDIRGAIDTVAEMSRALATEKSIIFSMESGEIGNPYVFADALHINEVIINLISNAIKYTHCGGRVNYNVSQISVPRDGVATYRFEVSDTGIGMSEEFQKHMFETFSREESATASKTEGAGLGLSIVKKIVDLAGGTISVKSRLSEGSVFTVELPLKVMTDEEIAEFEESRKNATLPVDEKFAGKRVLLVDDNAMNREIANDILTEAGLTVETAEDGEIALKKVTERGVEYYNFILMDIQMPIMNGYDTTRAIRSLQDGWRVPIIALSANAFEEDKAASVKAGMNAHVVKPINVKELFACLGRFI